MNPMGRCTNVDGADTPIEQAFPSNATRIGNTNLPALRGPSRRTVGRTIDAQEQNMAAIALEAGSTGQLKTGHMVKC
jgi:hypothetical protein